MFYDSLTMYFLNLSINDVQIVLPESLLSWLFQSFLWTDDLGIENYLKLDGERFLKKKNPEFATVSFRSALILELHHSLFPLCAGQSCYYY